jgi:NAD(P)-dependent dehydrogenase (short-subunit alcohol dehydrogenase family)
MSKIMVVGASGTIGRAVVDLLGQTHQVIRVGNRQGDYTVDLSSKASIENVFEKIESIDAAICAAGLSRFGKLGEASDDDFLFSINNKLMGQVNLVRIAQQHVSPNGSITVTTGLLAREPWPGTVPTAMVNAALEGFVRAAALDAPNGIRINAVSPILVTETATKMGMDKAGTMSAVETAKAYQSCIAGKMTGQVLDVRDFGKVE